MGKLIRTLSQPLLWLQRTNTGGPVWMRSAFRTLLARVHQRDIDLLSGEDWSTPIVNRPGARPDQTEADREPAQVPCITPTARASGGNDLRCAVITSSLDVGGMDEFVVFLASRLGEFGIEVAVLHASGRTSAERAPSGRLGQLLLKMGVETAELNAVDGAEWIRTWRPDVISAHCPAQWVLDSASALGIPLVETLHGMHELFNRDAATEAQRSKSVTRFVAVSDLVREQYLSINPTFPADRILTIPNGIDDNRRRVVDRAPARASLGISDEIVLLSLGRYCFQKNTYGLIDAFADVASKYRNAHLIVAGRADDTSYFAQIRRLKDRLPCRERVHLRDHHPDPSTLLAAADGFVLDSFFEGWALASTEALCAGIPVVLSEVGGAREQVTEGTNCGHLVRNPLGNPFRVDWKTMREAAYHRQVNHDEFVAATDRLIQDRDAAVETRLQLAKASQARFSPRLCLQRHAMVLKKAASRQEAAVCA